MSDDKMNAERVVEMLESMGQPGPMFHDKETVKHYWCPFCKQETLVGTNPHNHNHASDCEITRAIEWVREANDIPDIVAPVAAAWHLHKVDRRAQQQGEGWVAIKVPPEDSPSHGRFLTWKGGIVARISEEQLLALVRLKDRAMKGAADGKDER
ncbi:hypothetical protein LCGC14_2233300 [marine sediment metagenome]|uniref:Uncharacterized protein n=1 Tax=marine sediment metagenome TaxID=412755 RepID=A0A0F9FK32_9ZZZZ